jgi:hypothetical protein
MPNELLRARLNLYAVLQNLEELPRLDQEMGDLCADWDITVQFVVVGGPHAFVEFSEGRCRHGVGNHPHPTVKLLFVSSKHLNDMFEGGTPPIPAKGFSRLGFLQKDFAKLTDRLSHYLKPDPEAPFDAAYARVNTILTFYTAAHAIPILAELDPTCQKITAGTPKGAVQLEILPDGPFAHVHYADSGVRAAKGKTEEPMARMSFRDMEAAHGILNGATDSFLALADGGLTMHGLVPIVENTGLMLDRLEAYLS